MATTPEGKVKKRVAKHLKNAGVYFFYPATGGYGASGVPDIVGCYKGRFIAIECKAGKNKPTQLQQMHIDQINDAGGVAWVANEENMDDVLGVLELMDVLQSYA